MSNREGARKGDAKVVAAAPDFCLTPAGPSQVPVPYPIMASFNDSTNLSSNVRFGGEAAFLLGQSSIRQVTGDEAGVGKGVKSGTIRGKVEAQSASSTVRVNGKKVVRHGDPCQMNNGNTLGFVVFQPGAMPSGSIDVSGQPTVDTNPPVSAKNPDQESSLKKLEDWMNDPVEPKDPNDQTVEILKGEFKSAVNTIPETGDLMIQGSALQQAGDMQQQAVLHRLLGDTQTAEMLEHAGDNLLKTVQSNPLPKFEMTNSWQVIGDKVMQAELLIANIAEMGVAGIAKLKGLRTAAKAAGGAELLGKTGKLEAAAASETAAATKAAEKEALQAADQIQDAQRLEASAAKNTPSPVQENSVLPKKSAGTDGLQVSKMSKAQKGVFGEACADEYMLKKGYTKMNGDPVKVGDKPHGQGIDGVWKHPGPPPRYAVTEAKFGSSRLAMTKDGRQMSNKWIKNRLDKAVGDEAFDVQDALMNNKVEKWLLNVDESGKVVSTLLK